MYITSTKQRKSKNTYAQDVGGFHTNPAITTS